MSKRYFDMSREERIAESDKIAVQQLNEELTTRRKKRICVVPLKEPQHWRFWKWRKFWKKGRNWKKF